MANRGIPEYVTINECATMLSVNPITVRRWGKANKLNIQRFGKIYLIPKAEVERMMVVMNVPDF